MTNLTNLRLDNTHVTDAGIAQLKGLTRLEKLSLRGTRVTDVGVADLKRSLAGVSISR